MSTDAAAIRHCACCVYITPTRGVHVTLHFSFSIVCLPSILRTQFLPPSRRDTTNSFRVPRVKVHCRKNDKSQRRVTPAVSYTCACVYVCVCYRTCERVAEDYDRPQYVTVLLLSGRRNGRLCSGVRTCTTVCVKRTIQSVFGPYSGLLDIKSDPINK